MDDLSHKICLVSRENRDKVTSLPIVKPITPNMHSKLVCQFRKLERQEQVRIYKRFAINRDSRAVAGFVFEAAGQVRLQDGMDLELLPMVPRSREDTLLQWYSIESDVFYLPKISTATVDYKGLRNNRAMYGFLMLCTTHCMLQGGI